MRIEAKQPLECKRERGATLYVVAASLVVILGLAGLAIDLVALYVGRSEAQRAVDAAALAGAHTFVTSGYTVGAVTSSSACSIASAAAASEGSSNQVAGQTLAVSNFTSSCDFSHNVVGGVSQDPLITVSTTATMPVFFMRIFGLSTKAVSAQGTAEAFSGSGCASCLKPFFLPNCDPVHTTPANPACPNAGAAGGYWIDPSTGNAANAGDYPSGSRGEPWTLHTVSGPSQWYEIAFDEAPPSCVGGGGSQSKTDFENSVQKCTTATYACGDQLCALNGASFGPNGHAVGCLITYGQSCNSQSVNSTDTISTQSPFTITAGPGNPFTTSGTITQSASLITVPLYNPACAPGKKPPCSLPPGGGPQTIVGWMQLFIRDVNHNGPTDDIDVLVLSVSGCGNANGGGSNGCTAAGGGASFLPVRLVQKP